MPLNSGGRVPSGFSGYTNEGCEIGEAVDSRGHWSTPATALAGSKKMVQG